MIYYTNVKTDQPHMAFIGRWSPLHKGHISIMEKKRKENPEKPILILVRDTDFDGYSAPFRAELVKIWIKERGIKGTIMIIPDIEGVYWGRDVGYNTEMVEVNERIKNISATEIRNGIKNGNKLWKKNIACEGFSHLLTDQTSKIAESGLVIWLTGCPCSGKTTISIELVKKIRGSYPHIRVQQLDGDVIRNTPMAQGVGFSHEDRALHIKRMAQLAKMFANQGILVICAFVSPNKKIRNQARKIIGKKRFIKVYIKASQKTRIKRDGKGLYAKAIAGKISNLTGYNASYEEPDSPDLICNTDRETIKESVEKLFNYLFFQKKS